MTLAVIMIVMIAIMRMVFHEVYALPLVLEARVVETRLQPRPTWHKTQTAFSCILLPIAMPPEHGSNSHVEFRLAFGSMEVRPCSQPTHSRVMHRLFVDRRGLSGALRAGQQRSRVFVVFLITLYTTGIH